MTARDINPIEMASAFTGAAQSLPPEILEGALRRLAKMVIEGHPDFLLHGNSGELSQFFRQITGIVGDHKAPDSKKGDAVATFVHIVSNFVARNGEDEDVTRFHEALRPVDIAPIRKVVDAGMIGHRRMREVYDGALPVRPNRMALQF